MKHAPFFFILALLAVGCGTRTEELEQQVNTLQGQNQELTLNNSSQDAYIDQVVASINEIYRDIEMTRSTEKNLLSETKGFEGGMKLTRTEVRQQLMDRIAAISGTLRSNSDKLSALQKDLNANRRKYTGLQTMVANLRKTIEEREQSITMLQVQVQGLETEVAAKTTLVASKDSVIGEKDKELATVYYIIGTRDELEKKGIIRDEGGFLSIGETTVISSGLDNRYFTPVDKNDKRIFHVVGEIDEILPKREAQFYLNERVSGSESLLTVADLDHFWQDKYLVILVD
jgi:predicted  nucleic acid-binding Zn-ribbon protein